MKKLKLITAAVAVLVLSNFVYAGNPTKKDYTLNLADNMVKHLCKDINLTDSQKLVIQTFAKEYETKLRNINQVENSESKKTINKQIVLEYRSGLDNILTKEQIDTLRTKRIERSLSALNNNKIKK